MLLCQTPTIAYLSEKELQKIDVSYFYKHESANLRLKGIFRSLEIKRISRVMSREIQSQRSLLIQKNPNPVPYTNKHHVYFLTAM